MGGLAIIWKTEVYITTGQSLSNVKKCVIKGKCLGMRMLGESPCIGIPTYDLYKYYYFQFEIFLNTSHGLVGSIYLKKPIK